jgi:hypothetical protein
MFNSSNAIHARCANGQNHVAKIVVVHDEDSGAEEAAACRAMVRSPSVSTHVRCHR